jgi:hypothetical protein
MNHLGSIQALYRHPVKSLGGEQLELAHIESYGMYGDRSHAFINSTKTGWDRFITARNYPRMLSYKASFQGEGTPDAFPQVTIMDETGHTFTWNEEFLQHFRQTFQQDAHMEQHLPTSSDVLAVDASSLLIVTDASIRAMERLWGKPLDPRRFRPNLVVALENDTPFVEADWIGKHIRIGEGADAVTLQIDEPCERCSLITLDPDTYERDPSLLKKLHQERKAFFGVYASVQHTGIIQQQDPVYVQE